MNARDVRMVAGERVELRRNPRRRRNAAARREQGRIVVELPPTIPGSDEERWLTTMVELLQRRESRRRRDAGDDALMRRASELHARYLAPYEPTAALPASVSWVDNQGRRWGSCTVESRTIRLSSRLREMPGWVVDYVLLHELAHLVESGHGPTFWALLAHYPRTEEAKGYLVGWADAMSSRSEAGWSAEPCPGDVDQGGD